LSEIIVRHRLACCYPDIEVLCMRQLLYVSRADPRGRHADLDGIMFQSRHNNAIDGITGLLWTDRHRFLQVIEGPEESVEDCFARIRADNRHRDVTVLLDTAVEKRQFGAWSMERRDACLAADGYDERMRRLLDSASAEVAEAFRDLIQTREAA
jgi:hypothetical protein